MITRPLNQLDLTTDVNYSIEKVPVVKNTHLSSDPTHYPTNQIIQNKVIRLKNSPAFKLTFIKRQVNPNTKATMTSVNFNEFFTKARNLSEPRI